MMLCKLDIREYKVIWKRRKIVKDFYHTRVIRLVEILQCLRHIYDKTYTAYKCLNRLQLCAT